MGVAGVADVVVIVSEMYLAAEMWVYMHKNTSTTSNDAIKLQVTEKSTYRGLGNFCH